MTDLAAEIKRLMASRNEDAQLAQDLFRILVYFHGVCWKSELPKDIDDFYRLLEEEKGVPTKRLDKAVSALKKLKLINVDKRPRGHATTSGTYTDEFLAVVDLKTAETALRDDLRLLKYSIAKGRQIREALKLQK